MRKFTIPFLALSLLTLAACKTSSLTELEKTPVAETTVEFDGTMKGIDMDQSVLSFVGGSDVIDHEGKFTDYTAGVTLDTTEPSNLEKAVIAVAINLASAVTDAEGLTQHLQREDFFFVEQHPRAIFASTGIVKTDATHYAITGDLTVKGVTKSVTISAEITNDYLTAHYDFPRQEFGIGNDSYGNKLLDTTVAVDVKLVFTK